MGLNSAHGTMPDVRIRRMIAQRAAQLMYARDESEYFTAKRKAARQFGVDADSHPSNLPSNAEIRDEIQLLANLLEGDQRAERLTEMRVEALRLMRKLSAFHPHLIGSVLTGHIRAGSDIDIHLFSNSIAAITAELDDWNLPYEVEHKRVVKHNEERVFTHIHVQDRQSYELTVYPADKINYPFRSSITGDTMEKATILQLEALLARENPLLDLNAACERLDDHLDVYELFALLLRPLEQVRQNPKYHPEGDALYHTLQVFELARDARPYDEEFLLAALLHDVGKAIDPTDHVAAALEALEGAITPRTVFLIEHHMQAHAYRDGTLGARARKRLSESEWFEDLMALEECDRAGRRCGVQVCTIDEALQHVRDLAEETD